MACFTADRSSGDVVVVVVVAKGGAGCSGGADIGACAAGGSAAHPPAPPQPASRAVGRSDRRRDRERARPVPVRLLRSRCALRCCRAFSPLTAGRCRGKGTCPDGGAACASPVRTHKQARTPIIRKPGTFPPGGRVADLQRISSAGSVEETLTWGSGCDKLQFCGESRADNATDEAVSLGRIAANAPVRWL